MDALWADRERLGQLEKYSVIKSKIHSISKLFKIEDRK